MIVYVESNFVLELALAQEQSTSAGELLALAATAGISLAIPAFSISEPFGTVTHRARERQKLRGALREQLKDLQRSSLHANIEDTFKPTIETLLELERSETDRLADVTERVLASAERIALTAAVFDVARRRRANLGLSMQDAIVLASVIADARDRDTQEPKCFISRNFQDFGRADIVAQLDTVNCRYASSFDEGLQWTRSLSRPTA